MRTPWNLAAAAAAALALAASLAGCSDFPAGDPNPSTVRVYLDRDFDQTWQLAECNAPDEESLAVTGTNAAGERIVIDISGGTGNATIFAGTTTIALSGTIDDYDFDAEDQLFDAEGEYRAGEEEGKLELRGNCSSA
jgi:hypothetical protein